MRLRWMLLLALLAAVAVAVATSKPWQRLAAAPDETAESDGASRADSVDYWPPVPRRPEG